MLGASAGASGVAVCALDGTFTIEDGRVSGEARFVPDAQLADTFVVVADGALHAVGEARVEQHETLDETRRQCRVFVDHAPATPLDIDPEKLRVRALILTSAELLGVAAGALDLAVAYAKEREQFGRPIGSFQAIKHTCADMLVELELGRALVEAAVDDPGPISAAAAKAFCSDMARAVTADLIQVHGGIGFTWDCDAHLFYRRAQSLAALHGGGLHHRDSIAAHLRAG